MLNLPLTKKLKIHDGEKRQPLQQKFLGKVVIHLQKPETKSIFITMHYYQLKMDQGS
jgi:hypothetical protein